MPNVKNNASAQETRRKLIDAAGHIFARHGLHGSTMKQITDLAGANTAAINYHFSDKFELYAAVVRHALTMTPICGAAADTTLPAEERLRAHITEVMKDLYDPSRPAWRAALLAHEFAQPTAALEAVMEELIRPRSLFLQGIVREILGPTATKDEVLRSSLSVAAQFFFHLYNSEVIRRLHPHLVDAANSEKLVLHIADFSIAALRGVRRRRTSRRKTLLHKTSPHR